MNDYGPVWIVKVNCIHQIIVDTVDIVPVHRHVGLINTFSFSFLLFIFNLQFVFVVSSFFFTFFIRSTQICAQLMVNMSRVEQTHSTDCIQRIQLLLFFVVDVFYYFFIGLFLFLHIFPFLLIDLVSFLHTHTHIWLRFCSLQLSGNSIDLIRGEQFLNLFSILQN